MFTLPTEPTIAPIQNAPIVNWHSDDGKLVTLLFDDLRLFSDELQPIANLEIELGFTEAMQKSFWLGEQLVLVPNSPSVYVWNAHTFEPLERFPILGYVANRHTAELNADESLVAEVGGTLITIWNVQTGEIIYQIQTDVNMEAVTWHPQTSLLAGLDIQGNIHLWRFDGDDVELEGIITQVGDESCRELCAGEHRPA